MIGFLKSLIRARLGGITHIRQHRAMIGDVPSIPDVVATLATKWPQPATEGNHSPIFVLSSSWRAGSTAVQRLIMSPGNVLVWGEPYHDCNYVHRLADSLRALGGLDPGLPQFSRASDSEDLSKKWVAVMSPEPSQLRAAHAAFFEALLGSPALELGYERWGLKEVRFGLDEALYLRWVFPEARFVVLYRNPYEAYRSYRVFPTWYSRWPQEPVLSAGDFANHWVKLTAGLLEGAEALGAHVIAHEDLSRAPEEVAHGLSDHLGLAIDPSPLAVRVTGRGRQNDATQPPRVSWAELRAVEAVAGDLARGLGYAPRP